MAIQSPASRGMRVEFDDFAASGAVVAPLHGTGVFPHGDQYYEFWGIDDASGQPWYRVAAIPFQ